ncbi:DUF11 domain-containing protein [Bacillus sp. Cs-700]|uniref:DUF11 domain-containing protein n=1 Tax=Bacillus sp. Cs-700 TaxID=2589818 RepID=UPI001409F6CC|nr:DUF11 domain-containing protein [Bacillus sp. Cs-700]
MPYIQRFTTTTDGSMTFTGNTLGLSKQNNTLAAGTQGSIGSFITLQNTGVPTYPTPPPGTTQNYTESLSSAILHINNVAGLSRVLYAELIWEGQYLTNNQDISGLIDNPIQFVDPSGNVYSIPPDPATSFEQVFNNGSETVGYYVRSRDVTSIVAAQLEGTYSAGAVPALLDPASNSNHAGWTLAVIYEDPTQPPRFMTLFVGLEAIISTGTAVDITITGFNTPVSGPINGRLLVSAGEGDASITGDQLLFGPTVPMLTTISGLNNPVNNFFGSQINNDSGNLDTLGTFGDRNANPFTATNINAGRQGWDITNVDVSFALINNQSSAVVQLRTAGDGYAVNALGVQFDVNAPVFESVKTATPATANVGDVITYTVGIVNTGLVSAEVVLFDDVFITPGGTFVPGTLIVDGEPNPGDPTVSPISLGTIEPGQSVNISFQIRVTSQPETSLLSDATELFFQFESTPGGPVFQGVSISNQVDVLVQTPLPPIPSVPVNFIGRCKKCQKKKSGCGQCRRFSQ